MTNKPANKFRWDIQGLRAFAVLAVVFFHISPEKFPGGFLGVDIFFVISGYLIIGFVCRDLALNKFSLKAFYAKRIKRLFPALLATIIGTLVLSYFILLPEETKNMAESAVSTLLYISNFYFYTQSDYFDANLEFAPLLHTWSLSVEEQFYIIMPILLLLTIKYLPRRLTLMLTTIALVSFIASVYIVDIDRSLAFFISPTRFWQFIVGGLLALHIDKFPLSKTVSNIFGFSGLITLVICIFIYNEETVFPGVHAIIPTFATLLILYAGNQPAVFTRLMSNKTAQFFGNISYSLYLWHWPVIVFYDLSIHNEFSRSINAGILLTLSVVLGYLSWRFIEIPCKGNNKRNNNATLFGALVASISTILIISPFLNGLSSRYSAEQLYYSSFINYDRSGFRQGICFLSSEYNDIGMYDKDRCDTFEEGKFNVLLIGDSHAAHWYSALNELSNEHHSITQVTASGCRPLVTYSGRERCTQLMRYAFEELIQKHRYEKIIVSGRWHKSGEIKGLVQTTEFLKDYTDDVVVIGPTMEYHLALPRVLATNEISEIKNDKQNRYSVVRDIDNKLKQQNWPAEVNYFSLIDILCQKAEQCSVLTDSGAPIAFDYGHLTHTGAKEIIGNNYKTFFAKN